MECVQDDCFWHQGSLASCLTDSLLEGEVQELLNGKWEVRLPNCTASLLIYRQTTKSAYNNIAFWSIMFFKIKIILTPVQHPREWWALFIYHKDFWPCFLIFWSEILLSPCLSVSFIHCNHFKFLLFAQKILKG